MKNVSIIGIDLSKNSFQIHGAYADRSVAFRQLGAGAPSGVTQAEERAPRLHPQQLLQTMTYPDTS